MAEVHTISEKSSEKLRGRERRSLNLSTKLTAAEAKAIEEAASEAGKTPSEWARDLLVRNTTGSTQKGMEMHIFTELVGLQMLLMNTLEPLLRGDKLNTEQIATRCSLPSFPPRSSKRPLPPPFATCGQATATSKC